MSAAEAEPEADTLPPPRPAHYKVVSISLYLKDIDHLDGLVRDLKARGVTKANRSALIRYALEQVDLERIPRGM